MDKYEYKVRADEIKSLIAEGAYTEAVKIADAIDWRRVKSVMMLCTISDLYKINRRYEDSRDILLLAYERHTGGRLIVYSLCELSIKLGEYVQALEYYKEFVQLAPKDSGRFILQYRLYEAQEVSLEERIGVLEELKKYDYREKWAYELAYLYHKVGMETQCVSECDQMIIWFGEGKFVFKALELKMLHTPLTPEQQEKYELMKVTGGNIPETEPLSDQESMQEEAQKETEEEEDDEFSLEENLLAENTQELPGKDIDIQVKTVDVSQYNTINLQKELAESMKAFLDENKSQPTQPVEEEDAEDLQITQVFEPVIGLDSPTHPVLHQDTDEMQLITDAELDSNMADNQEMISNTPDHSMKEEVFFGNTAEVNIEDVVSELATKNETSSPFTPIQTTPIQTTPIQSTPIQTTPMQSVPEANPNPSVSNTGIIRTFHKPSGYDDILSQEYDGQISLVVPEQEQVEKQITGQLRIEDIMAEWERMKQENERKRMEEIRKRVQQQTDTLFADFDESTKSGLLEELEKAMVSAAMMEEKIRVEQERPKVVKVADIAKAQPAMPIEATLAGSEQGATDETTDYAEVAEVTESAQETAVEVADVTQQEQEVAPEDTEEIDNSEVAETVESEQESTDEVTEAAVVAEGEETAAEVTEEATVASDETKPVQEVAEAEVAAADDNISKYNAREMTDGEKTQFAPFIHHKRTRRQIVEAIDNISMASYTGNVVISGEEGTGTTALAKLLVKEVQLSDNNFSGKVAKISGVTMNKKDVGNTVSKLANGALIIEGAAAMKSATVEQLIKELEQEGKGLIVLIEDTKANINEFLAKYSKLETLFPLRVDVEALDDQTLVKYAKKYALEEEYSIDDLGVLALHTRIAEMQTSDHEVTLSEIEELVDEAIYYADKKTPKHFFDVLFGKRYDEEDMIVLREKDFMHN